MCESILADALEGKISVHAVTDWLTNSHSKEECIFFNECLQADFVSYFLNYIHKIQIINKTKSTNFDTITPVKAQYTNNASPNFRKKRSALFSSPKANGNDSYLSPVSPLYNAPFNSPTRVCFGDFITNTPKSTNKRKIVRRINPTSLNYNDKSIEFGNNSFSFDGVSDNTDGQRSVLAQERLKIVSTQKSSLCDLNVKSLIINNSKHEILPCVEQVTYKDHLDKLILIYNHLVNNNYIPNLISELHFLITVILAKEYENENDSTLFESIHNRVYFASNVLCHFNSILGLLDRTTLRLILENKRLLNFVVLKPLELKSNIENIEYDVHNENVCFVVDTDNNTNFPNNMSFSAFRKQRDLFYEILRIWENNHLQEEWNFSIALGGKIKSLLNMYGDVANMVHLARLFKSQLLMNTCGKSNSDLSFISAISNVNAEKLERLKNRIINKHTSNGIHAIPTFTGYEEFYYNFILVGCHSVFNKHLNDVLISNIIELNDIKFDCVGLDGAETVIDQSTKKSYVVCLKSLRILAKFLGFLDALPYMSQMQLQNGNTCYIDTRSATQPSINLVSIVNQMYELGNLILTIPWLTEYLAMMDYTALRLPYFEIILHKLFGIYCTNITIPVPNLLFIKINLGWLFELPHFPGESFFNWLKKNMSNVLLRISTLDALDIVDHNIIYMCCPYLNEIKQLLSNDAGSINNTVKHITPLTSIQPTQKRLQLQLEEAFFNGQPVSVRKTVEFVSERVASACVKHICNELVPNFRNEALCEFRHLEYSNMPAIESIAMDKVKRLRQLLEDSVKTMIGNRVGTAIIVLLASDVLSQTKNVCVNIAEQTCMDRVQQWINSHVNTDIFINDFKVELRKLSEVKLTKSSTCVLPAIGKHNNDDVISGKQCVENIRNMCWKLLEESENITLQGLSDLMDAIYISIQERSDANESIVVLTCNMFVDVILLLLAHRPDLMNNKFEEKLFNIWRLCEDNLFKTFLSPRNILLLMQSANIELTEKQYAMFIGSLFNENFLTEDAFECQVTAIFEQDLTKDMKHFFYNTLKYISKNQSTKKEKVALICTTILNQMCM